ncbi:MAG: hypothetical protein HEQ37_10350 [Acidovorax sp.]|nr:hypothetical protein [Acidovorax sp.]
MPALLLGAAALFASNSVSAQSLGLFLSPPGEQNTTRAGATVEGFSGTAGAIGATGNFAVGAWSGATAGVNRAAANSFGGAGGTGSYLGLSNGSQVSVTLTGDRKYVGFWWSAGNTGNTIEFYDDTNNLLATFTTNSLTTLLSGGGNITAINGNQYAKAAYFGNPNPPSGRNTGEAYGYVNLLLQGTTVSFRRIVIRHAGGGGFELDNLAVSDSATVPGAWVNYGTVTVSLPPGAIGSADDTASTARDTAVSGNVATNDTTVAGSTFVVSTAPTNGSVVLDPATGAYTYTPNTGFVGADTFTYRQCKPAPDQAVCVTASVKVTVAPRAVNDTGATAMDTPLNASVANERLRTPRLRVFDLHSTRQRGCDSQRGNRRLHLHAECRVYRHGHIRVPRVSAGPQRRAVRQRHGDDHGSATSGAGRLQRIGQRNRHGRPVAHGQLHLQRRERGSGRHLDFSVGAQSFQQRGGRCRCGQCVHLHRGGWRCWQLPVLLRDAGRSDGRVTRR